jgi:TRAP-type C4-dicarboxylate transport system permease small subunit
MALNIGLSDKQQAWFMFFALLLATWTPILSSWLNMGAPTDKIALAGLFASLLVSFMAAALAFLKEALGIVPPATSTAPPAAPPAAPPKAAVTPMRVLFQRKRLMFLAYLK